MVRFRIYTKKIGLLFTINVMLITIMCFSISVKGTEVNNTIIMDNEEELVHLLFAKLVYDYLDGYEGKTVEQYIKDKPDTYSQEIWEGSGITYDGLYCQIIGDWNIHKIQNNNKITGFYGVAFKKDNQVIVAFRGSEMFTEEFALDESNDWTGTDFKFAVMNELSEQFEDADTFLENICSESKELNITLTGHSLGGALVAYESIVSDYYGYSFDGACGHVIDLVYMYGYMDIDGFTGINDLENIKFCNYTDDTGYFIADLIQHTNTESMYQIDRETKLDDLNENTMIPKLADAGSHIIWSCVGYDDGGVYLNPKVNSNEYGYTYMPAEPVYLDITKNILETGMEKLNFDTPWNIVDYNQLDYKYLIGSATGIIKNGRVVLAVKEGGAINSYDGIGVTSVFDIDTVIYGGDGDDTLCGYVGDDVLIAGGGINVLDGNLGNDTYIIDKHDDSFTEIIDLGGERTSIIFRNININSVRKLKLEDGKICLNQNQHIKLNIAGDEKNVQFFTYNNGVLKRIGSLNQLDGYISGDLSELSEKNKKIVIYEGECTFDIFDDNGNLLNTVSNTEIDDFTMEVCEFGVVYTNGTQENKSVFAVISQDYDIQVASKTRGNLAFAMVDKDNNYIGCERLYGRKFKHYKPEFSSLSYIGSAPGEVELDDAVYSSVNFILGLFSN